MMKKIALAALAASFAFPAVATDYVTSTIVAVDAQKRTVTLSDKSIMLVSPDVDLTPVKPGMKAAIVAFSDEDGFQPATAIKPQE